MFFCPEIAIAERADIEMHGPTTLPGPQIMGPKVLQDSYLKGSPEEKELQCKNEVASSLGEDCSFCHNDDVTLLANKGKKAKKMMRAAVAIGVKCDYCHAGNGAFTEKKEIAEKMLELSKLMGVDCNYCHAGKDTFTHEGNTAKTAMVLQEWGKTGSRKCLDCHVEGKQFEFNFRGWEILNTQKGLLGL